MAPRPIERVMLTPELAASLIENNTQNRPISDPHVKRLVAQITKGKWRFNGDTIKVGDDGQVLDGQHRCWAVVEAKKAVETVIIYGVARDAFSTIDTLRKPRSGGDVIALAGQGRYRTTIAAALAWLIRWQRGCLVEFRAPSNRIENSDIEAAFDAHPAMAQAVERVRRLRSLVNQPIIAFLYYVLANRNPDLAERMVSTLEDPAGVSVGDAFFRLRTYFTTEHHRRKDPVMMIALAIKAINAAYKEERINTLVWKNQGARAEAFPVLKVE